ncbi:hypothetical protein FM038_007055 [Shewanella eurypsychrophilus]|uniref:Lipoprotein n=1 Tax=Shewanella eurypsychrophilus TaxID=2593656 RepID=A0ABX6V3L0_9GAMM|nr:MULTISPECIES: hypothetical protein [Shewanella]QFU21932.1 hypothetical protein FS418_08635 [Shewanella sp. YLB-09]QPG57221.1 hypothetical protein FM038_007055 [Shewanella eurypsychrophilus]
MKSFIALATLAALIVGCTSAPRSVEVITYQDGSIVCKTITDEATEYIDIKAASECPIKDL